MRDVITTISQLTNVRVQRVNYLPASIVVELVYENGSLPDVMAGLLTTMYYQSPTGVSFSRLWRIIGGNYWSTHVSM